MKQFLLGGREAESLTTQPSGSILFMIGTSNWNKLELCLSRGGTWCVRRDWLTLYWKRKERSDRRATSPTPLVATCLRTGVDSDTERAAQAGVPHGVLIWKVFNVGVWGGEEWWWWAQNIATENLKTTDKKEVKVKAAATEGLL